MKLRQEIGYWPSPQYLRERTLFGSKKRGYSFIGEGNNSPGSDLIIKLADEKDDRPLVDNLVGRRQHACPSHLAGSANAKRRRT